MVFYSVEQLLSEAKKQDLPLWKLILNNSAGESGISPDGHWVGLRLKKPAKLGMGGKTPFRHCAKSLQKTMNGWIPTPR